MEKDNIKKDDFLGRLITGTPLESPSDDFISNVMSGIPMEPLLVKEKRPFFLMVKRTAPWLLLSIAVIAVLFTSDIPFLNLAQGKNYFTQSLVPYLAGMFGGLKSLFAGGKVATYTLMIIFAGGGLLALDYFLNNRVFARHRAA